MLHCPADDISISSLKRDIGHYSWETFRQDLLAGFSVAFLTVPQAMAYALLAGLPISCGLFAAIYSSIITALFGSSRHLVVGPSNAIAILIQAGTAEILFNYYRDITGIQREMAAFQILVQLTLVTGILQMIAAWCRLGRLTRFVSYSVVIAYISGTALAVVINQLFIFLGVPRLIGAHSLYEHIYYFFSNLSEIQLPTAIVGAISMAVIVTLRRMNRKIPGAVIAIIIASTIVESLGLSSYSGSSALADFFDEHGFSNILVIGDTWEEYNIVPSLSLPFVNMRILNGILPVAFAIALLSVMETTSVAKSIASNSGQRLSVNQEIFGIGLGNLVSTLIGGMPVSGSPSRSNLNYFTGAQTRFASIFNALIVVFIVYMLGFAVTRVPLTALASLLLVTAMNIINRKQLLVCLKATSSDALVFWITLFSCIFLSLDMAFYIGVALSIILYLTKAAVPQLVEYELDESGELKALDSHSAEEHRDIRFIKVEGELFFGAADLFQITLKTLTEDDTSTRVIILQLKNARDIDATACLALQQLHDYLKNSGRHLVACGLTCEVWDTLCNAGLIEQLGKENLFAFDERHPHLHMQKAYLWAKALVAVEKIHETEEPQEHVVEQESEIKEPQTDPIVSPNA